MRLSYWERDDLLALLYVMLCDLFFTFSYGALGQMRYLTVLIPDLCLLPCLNISSGSFTVANDSHAILRFIGSPL